jgi:hypothetical protein
MAPLGWRLSFMPDGLYSPECVEGEFSELRLHRILRSSLKKIPN